MENQVTANPFVIMLINMTIVFGVLFILNLFIRLIYFLDPTKPKKVVVKEAAARVVKSPTPAPAPVAPVPAVPAGVSSETVAVIAGALAAYGIGFSQIKAIRPVERGKWAGAARLNGLRNGK